jgi:hypothetical protein
MAPFIILNNKFSKLVPACLNIKSKLSISKGNLKSFSILSLFYLDIAENANDLTKFASGVFILAFVALWCLVKVAVSLL